MIHIDLEKGEVTLDGADGEDTHSLATDEGFAAVSKAWLRSGWDAKYVYSFTWMGRPVTQLPDDMIRIQEVIHAVQPDVIIETGIAHGGSLVFYEEHPLASYLTLIEGSSVDPDIVASVAANVRPGEQVLVLLDSNHTKAHVQRELEAYAPLVSPGSYIVATDGIMHWLGNAPRTQPDWVWNNPSDAVHEFVAGHREFILEEPPQFFNEGAVRRRVSYWPDAFLRRVQ